MKKRICSVIAVVALILTISVHALEPRAIIAVPILSFRGTTACCSVICRGNSDSDEVSATLTLYQGTTRLDSWSGSGVGQVEVSGEYTAISGKSYKLVASCSVNGKLQPSVATTNTCP